jgi:hypothetical protein
MPVFSLEEARALQVKNIINKNSLSWPEYSNYGYLCGGTTPTIICTITRLDFSNETVSLPTKNLPTARGYSAAFSNSN